MVPDFAVQEGGHDACGEREVSAVRLCRRRGVH